MPGRDRCKECFHNAHLRTSACKGASGRGCGARAGWTGIFGAQVGGLAGSKDTYLLVRQPSHAPRWLVSIYQRLSTNITHHTVLTGAKYRESVEIHGWTAQSLRSSRMAARALVPAKPERSATNTHKRPASFVRTASSRSTKGTWTSALAR